MELVTAFSTIVAAMALTIGPWIVLALLALRFGVDSRPGLGDDHRPRSGASSRWIGP